MSDPTPGPWAIRSTSTLFSIHGDGGSVMVASTSWHSHIRSPYPLQAEAAANARLIAYAPDMLEALRETFDLLKHEYGEYAYDEPEARTLRKTWAAIAKASGWPLEGQGATPQPHGTTPSTSIEHRLDPTPRGAG